MRAVQTRIDRLLGGSQNNSITRMGCTGSSNLHRRQKRRRCVYWQRGPASNLQLFRGLPVVVVLSSIKPGQPTDWLVRAFVSRVGARAYSTSCAASRRAPTEIRMRPPRWTWRWGLVRSWGWLCHHSLCSSLHSSFAMGAQRVWWMTTASQPRQPTVEFSVISDALSTLATAHASDCDDFPAESGAAANVVATAVAPAAPLASMEQVRQLLLKLNLVRYAGGFEAAGYDDADFLLLRLSVDEAQRVVQTVGMKPGHAHKFVHFVKMNTSASFTNELHSDQGWRDATRLQQGERKRSLPPSASPPAHPIPRVVHLGPHKSASSHTQAFLMAASEQLLLNGWHWPRAISPGGRAQPIGVKSACCLVYTHAPEVPPNLR